jgi:hypothetical protein
MLSSSQSVTATLPGPATAPDAHFPGQLMTHIPMQPLSSSAATVSGSVDEETRLSMAWKYEGYQALSKWMASDDDFFVFRRFESLNANTMLWMQDRISQLEQELANIHQTVEDSKPAQRLKNNSFRWDAKYMQRRDQIMAELSRQLLYYSESSATAVLNILLTCTHRSVHRRFLEDSHQTSSG